MHQRSEGHRQEPWDLGIKLGSLGLVPRALSDEPSCWPHSLYIPQNLVKIGKIREKHIK